MPGTVVTVNVRSGQDVIRGEVLLTLEAMKMEATVRAERDGQIATVLIVPGQQVESKDLLITLV
jgi:pyruvate carboxylase